MDFRKLVWDRNAPAFVDYLTRPESGNGAFLTIAEPNPQVGLVVPDDVPAGEYLVRARVGVAPDMPAHRSFMEIGLRGDRAEGAMNVLTCQKLHGTLSKPEIIEIKLTLPAAKSHAKSVGSKAKAIASDRVIAFRERQPNSREAAVYAHNKSLEQTGLGIEPAIWIDWVQWQGPLVRRWPPASMSRLFFDRPAAHERRGLRPRDCRPVCPARLSRQGGADELSRQAHAALCRRPSRGHRPRGSARRTAGDRAGFAQFHLSVGTGRAASTRRNLTSLELASRLSYFLWSAPPDEVLLTLARTGELEQPAVLTAQVDRMLDDPKAWEFVRGFAYQWLSMERLDFFQFNYRLYPEFDESVKLARATKCFTRSTRFCATISASRPCSSPILS